MDIFDILPVPVCMISVSSIIVDSVRINCPFNPLSSTALRTASHNTGATCHQSLRLSLEQKRGLGTLQWPNNLLGYPDLVT